MLFEFENKCEVDRVLLRGSKRFKESSSYKDGDLK